MYDPKKIRDVFNAQTALRTLVENGGNSTNTVIKVDLDLRRILVGCKCRAEHEKKTRL